jgi:hypothetical protein
MKFDLNRSIEILERTPAVLSAMLDRLDEEWLFGNEGAQTWSPYDVLGHYIEGERTDWIPRMRIILSSESDKRFVPFDRFAQMGREKRPVSALLAEFADWRKRNLQELRDAGLDDEKLDRTGVHPEFGEVTLKELLAAWVVHDLNHIFQINRVMAKQYKREIGPWGKYITVVNR